MKAKEIIKDLKEHKKGSYFYRLGIFIEDNLKYQTILDEADMNEDEYLKWKWG